jgi:hypothetical protein
VTEPPKRPPRDDGDFLERLSELDRSLSAAGDAADADAAVDAWAEFAARRRSTPAPPRGGRPMLNLFPEGEERPATGQPSPPRVDPRGAQPFQDLDRDTDPDEDVSSQSPRRLAVLAAAFLLLMAAGAAAAAYVFRDDLAAILAAWQQR